MLLKERMDTEAERCLHELMNVLVEEDLVTVDEIIPASGNEEQINHEGDGRLILTEPACKTLLKRRIEESILRWGLIRGAALLAHEIVSRSILILILEDKITDAESIEARRVISHTLAFQLWSVKMQLKGKEHADCIKVTG